jgi:pimeloyl-ACP methyl ester carboxylesterase
MSTRSLPYSVGMRKVLTKTPKTRPTIGFVLIAGAGLDAWVWHGVIQKLTVSSLAISFPETESKKSMSLDDYTKTSLEQIKAWRGVDRYIIVGHSIGAVIALQLAQSLGSRVAGVAAIGSVIPKQGHSFFSTLPFPQNLLLPLITKLVGTRPPESTIKKSYCNDLSDTQTAEIVKRFQPESYSLYAGPLTAKLPDVPRLYVNLSKDKNTPPALQKAMAANLEATEVVLLDAGHLAMLAQPKKLANILNTFGTSLE